MKQYGNEAMICVERAHNMYQGGNFWAGSLSFISFGRDVVKLDIDYDKYEPWEALAKHGSWRMVHEDFVIISDFPTAIRLDENNRQHAENGPSIEWADGSCAYMWHGVAVPGKWFHDRNTITIEDCLYRDNVEERRVACEMKGWDNVLAAPELNPVVIDEHPDERIGKLIQVDLPDAEAQWFLKYQCGTGRYFAEPVSDKRYNTALKANAAGAGWRPEYNEDPMLYIPSIRS